MKLPMLAKYAITSLAVTGLLTIVYYFAHPMVKVPQKQSSYSQLLAIQLTIGDLRTNVVTDPARLTERQDLIRQLSAQIDANRRLVDNKKTDPALYDDQNQLIIDLAEVKNLLDRQLSIVTQLYQYQPAANFADSVKAVDKADRSTKAAAALTSMRDKLIALQPGQQIQAVTRAFNPTIDGLKLYASDPISTDQRTLVLSDYANTEQQIGIYLNEPLAENANTAFARLKTLVEKYKTNTKY